MGIILCNSTIGEENFLLSAWTNLLPLSCFFLQGSFSILAPWPTITAFHLHSSTLSLWLSPPTHLLFGTRTNFIPVFLSSSSGRLKLFFLAWKSLSPTVLSLVDCLRPEAWLSSKATHQQPIFFFIVTSASSAGRLSHYLYWLAAASRRHSHHQ